ncbi:uncharacterized protein [Haliotis cracherodii]|uniref:uncharacterized protein n=1 Tax=Haliotis cracherodii TaxID=6455 RepID=UPI0039EC4DC2
MSTFKYFRVAFGLLVITYVLYVIKHISTLTITWSTRGVDKPYNKSHLIVFTTFPLMTDPKYDKTHFRDPTPERVESRMADYVESLIHTLRHPCVFEVHIFYDQDGMPEYIQSRLGTQPKLKFDRIPNAKVYVGIFEFVHQHFKDKLVMITNGDIYPAEGFEKLDYDVMRDKRLFYSPSRHGRKEKRCVMRKESCDNGRYRGTHDSYIFIPDRELPAETKRALKYKWDDFGMENIILHLYMHKLNYRVSNPCYVLILYHNHCSVLRHMNRIRVRGLPYAIAAPTNTLS